ncbi:MAG TPA: ABC transporter permease subunit, partial [Acidimicrobiales bacterium]|nr:ABC transporter permease subunit [Acidimicrobiales bacterium]
VYVGLAVPLEVGLGIAGAWATLRRKGGQAVLAALFVLPLALPWTTAATLFTSIFEPGGELAGLLAHLGLRHPPDALADPTASFALVVAIGVWKGAPWCYLLMLGPIAALPAEVLEAARLDGARGITLLSRIVLPEVRPMLVFVTVFRVLAEAQAYTSASLLTGGGPYGSTELVSLYGDNLAFQDFVWGLAAALGTLVGAVLLVVAAGGVALMDARPGMALAARLARLASLARSRLARPARQGGTGSVRRGRRRRAGGMPARRGGRPAHRGVRRSPGGVLLTAALLVLALLPLAGGTSLWRGVASTGLAWRDVGPALRNSGAVTLETLAGTLALALPGAAALGRARRRLRRPMTFVVLLCLAIPGIVLLIPQYLELARFGLDNSLTGLALLYVAADLPLAIFFLRPAFAAVPGPLVEAMRVDGATAWRIMWRLVAPLTASTVVAVSVLVVVQAWSELLLASTVLTSSGLFTLPVLYQYAGASLGASWVSFLPPLLVFLACQRWFRRGLDRGALL